MRGGGGPLRTRPRKSCSSGARRHLPRSAPSLPALRSPRSLRRSAAAPVGILRWCWRNGLPARYSSASRSTTPPRRRRSIRGRRSPSVRPRRPPPRGGAVARSPRPAPVAYVSHGHSDHCLPHGHALATPATGRVLPPPHAAHLRHRGALPPDPPDQGLVLRAVPRRPRPRRLAGDGRRSGWPADGLHRGLQAAPGALPGAGRGASLRRPGDGVHLRPPPLPLPHPRRGRDPAARLRRPLLRPRPDPRRLRLRAGQGPGGPLPAHPGRLSRRRAREHLPRRQGLRGARGRPGGVRGR